LSLHVRDNLQSPTYICPAIDFAGLFFGGILSNKAGTIFSTAVIPNSEVSTVTGDATSNNK